MRKVAALLGLIATLSSAMGAMAEVQSRTLRHDGIERTYEIYVPSTYDGAPVSLVVMLHGFSDTIDIFTEYTQFSRVAERLGFVVAYPAGLYAETSWGMNGTHWNAHWGTGVDDLGYIAALTDHLKGEFAVADGEVFLGGLSNGAMMAYRVGCELGSKFSAIATVSGTVPLRQAANCDRTSLPPLIYIHGTNDDQVSYQDGIDQYAYSAEDTVEFWLRGADVVARPAVELPALDETSSVSFVDYLKDGETFLTFYTVKDGGHTWPGAIEVERLGTVNRDLDAGEAIWAFFQKVTDR